MHFPTLLLLLYASVTLEESFMTSPYTKRKICQGQVMSCLHHNSLVSQHIPPPLSLQSNANVLQPSAQQRRLRLVLRAGFLLTDVKPPWRTVGRSTTLTDTRRRMENKSVLVAPGLFQTYIWASHTHTHIKAHKPTSLEALQRELERETLWNPQQPDQPALLSLPLCLYS